MMDRRDSAVNISISGEGDMMDFIREKIYVDSDKENLYVNEKGIV